MISPILNALGLMKRSEHEAVKLRSAADGQLIRRLIDERDDWQGRFKLAATDLAKQAEEIAHFDECEKRLDADRNFWREQALRDERPAQMWRDYLKRSRDRKKGVGRG